MEQIGFFTALGVVVVFIAAMALGRIASVASGIPADGPAPDGPSADAAVPAGTLPVRTPGETLPARTGPGEDTAG
jgi:hypothetical protein